MAGYHTLNVADVGSNPASPAKQSPHGGTVDTAEKLSGRSPIGRRHQT